MKIRCLLIKLSDGRTFFTAKKNYPLLLEFAKIYDAQLKIVDAINPNLLIIKDLATKICDQTSTSNVKYYEKKVNYASLKAQTDRQKNLNTIRDYIVNQFSSGNFVKIKEINKELNNQNISASTLYRHINQIKTKLEKEGKSIIKVSPGVYKMEIK
jgi:hypothetical protein